MWPVATYGTLFITHCLRLNLQLHTIDSVRTCRISSFCTVAWQLARFQLTRRIARSLGDSWASCQLLVRFGIARWRAENDDDAVLKYAATHFTRRPFDWLFKPNNHLATRTWFVDRWYTAGGLLALCNYVLTQLHVLSLFRYVLRLVAFDSFYWRILWWWWWWAKTLKTEECRLAVWAKIFKSTWLACLGLPLATLLQK